MTLFIQRSEHRDTQAIHAKHVIIRRFGTNHAQPTFRAHQTQTLEGSRHHGTFGCRGCNTRSLLWRVICANELNDVVLLTFGSASGLSLVSPWTSTASSAKWVGALAVFWVIAQQIGSFLAGGYVAGRMRTRWEALPADEIEFRDGMHGALTWAIGALIGAMLAMSAAGSAGRAISDTAGHVAGAAAAQAAAHRFVTAKRRGARDPGIQ